MGGVIATVAILTPSLAAMMLLSRAHARIKNLRIVKAVIRGFLSGFIGLLLFVVLQFGVHSLVNGRTWAVLAVSVIYLLGEKRRHMTDPGNHRCFAPGVFSGYL